MPPCLDVYVRTSDLDRSRVEQFLDAALPGWRDEPVWSTDDIDQLEPALSGEVNNMAFHSSSGAVHDAADAVRVIVAFPLDGGVVLGISVNLEPDEDTARHRAVRALADLAELTGARDGFIGVEAHPPMTSEEWVVSVAWASSLDREWALVDGAPPTVRNGGCGSSSISGRDAVCGPATT
jgi:hypothetical protein